MTAKIKLNAASGGGSVSLEAPSSTTGNANVELKLPVADGSAGQFMKTDGSGNLAFASSEGISMFDQYRLTTSFTDGVSPISSNIERVDTHSPAFIGSAMSVSSGIFTFPSTGMYEVCFYLKGRISGDSRFHIANLMVTTDGTNFTEATQGANSYYNAGAAVLSSCVSKVFFDVTNTSTHKVRFDVQVNSGSTQTDGDTGSNQTYFTFKKIGDT